MTPRFSIFGIVPPSAPAGLKPWTEAERDRLLTECDAMDAAPRRAPKAASDHGWDAIFARMADPERFRARYNAAHAERDEAHPNTSIRT